MRPVDNSCGSLTDPKAISRGMQLTVSDDAWCCYHQGEVTEDQQGRLCIDLRQHGTYTLAYDVSEGRWTMETLEEETLSDERLQRRYGAL